MCKVRKHQAVKRKHVAISIIHDEIEVLLHVGSLHYNEMAERTDSGVSLGRSSGGLGQGLLRVPQ